MTIIVSILAESLRSWLWSEKGERTGINERVRQINEECLIAVIIALHKK